MEKTFYANYSNGRELNKKPVRLAKISPEFGLSQAAKAI